MKNGLTNLMRSGFIFLILWPGNIYGQQIVATAGGSGQNGSGSISYTIGELTISTLSDGNNTITQGFQQTQIIITAINDPEDPSIRIVAYPNPTYDQVTLRFENDGFDNAEFSLFDLHGKLILIEKFRGNEVNIDFEKYDPGLYLIKVMVNGKLLRTFKIIRK